MSRLLEYFNPLTIIEKLITIGITLVIAGALVWWFNSKIRDHYQAPLIAKYEAAGKEAIQLNAKRVSANKQRIDNASINKIKRLEAALLASNAANDSAYRLRNNLRPSAAFGTDNAACLRYTDTVNDILRTGEELARRIAKEADGHAADKIELTNAWPK